jgi:cobalt-zinc-cadmium efflux system membrane fusion protein
MITPPRFVFPLLLIAAGCSKAPESPLPIAAPQVTGNRIDFPDHSPQLSSLTAEAAVPRQLAVSHLTGRLYWNDDTTVRIFSPVTGRVSAVLADIGTSVGAGAPLARIRSPDYAQALADARTAAANLAAAQKTFERVKDLLAHGAAAQKDVEAAEAAERAAAAERGRASSRLQLYGGSETEAHVGYVLTSPVAGTVVERSVNPGQEVRNDQMLANAPALFAPLFVVADPRGLWLQLDAAETDLPDLKVGQRLRIQCHAFPGRVFAGVLEKIGEELDSASRTVKLRGAVQNPDLLLKAEMYVMVDVERKIDQRGGAGVEVASSAIFTIGDQSYLFVQLPNGHQFDRRAVKIGTEQDGKIPVLAGVMAGEKVVVEGALLLQAVLAPAN